MHPNDLENFVNTDWSASIEVLIQVCLHLSWEFVFLTDPVMLMLLLHGSQFEKHWYRVDILGLFSETTLASTLSQLLSI